MPGWRSTPPSRGWATARVPALIAAAAPELAVTPDGTAPAAYWLVAPTPQWRQAKVRALVESLTRAL